MQKIRLTIFWVAVMADLATQRPVPAPPIAELRIPYATHFFSFSSLQPFRRHHLSQSMPRLANSSSNKQHSLKAPIFPPVLLPMPVFKSATNSVLGYSEVEFDMVDLIPQDRVTGDVLRECSQSRDRKLERSIGWRIYPREALGRPSHAFVFLSVIFWLYLTSFRKLHCVVLQSFHHFHPFSGESYFLDVQRPSFKFSLTIFVKELSSTLRDLRSAPPHFYHSPSPAIARFREPIQLSST